MRLVTSQLPVYLDENTGKLIFGEGVCCGGNSARTVRDMEHLFHDICQVDEEEIVYEVYRDICFEEHRKIFMQHDLRYDMTVIHPGKILGECKKTSGHYHGYKVGTKYTYPEIYQVLKGNMIFLFQKDENPKEVEIVFVREGESVVIPPFYGHCAVNPMDDYVVFCNLAVISCPIFYDYILEKRGLAIRVFGEKQKLSFVENDTYGNINIRKVRPSFSGKFGSGSRESCYVSFVKNPAKYNFLSVPEEYGEQMEQLLQEA